MRSRTYHSLRLRLIAWRIGNRCVWSSWFSAGGVSRGSHKARTGTARRNREHSVKPAASLLDPGCLKQYNGKVRSLSKLFCTTCLEKSPEVTHLTSNILFYHYNPLYYFAKHIHTVLITVQKNKMLFLLNMKLERDYVTDWRSLRGISPSLKRK